jgi:hypothetical protein
MTPTDAQAKAVLELMSELDKLSDDYEGTKALLAKALNKAAADSVEEIVKEIRKDVICRPVNFTWLCEYLQKRAEEERKAAG